MTPLLLLLFVGLIAAASSSVTLLKLPRNQFLEVVGGAWSFFWWVVWSLYAGDIVVYSHGEAFTHSFAALTYLGYGGAAVMFLFSLMGVLGQLEPLETKSDLHDRRKHNG